MTTPATAGMLAWQDACLAGALLAVAPVYCGGAVLSAQVGPVRDNWLHVLNTLLPAETRIRRLPVNASPQRVVGGLDLTATLNAGHPVMQRGLLSEVDGGVVIAAMAERMDPSLAAQIGNALETGQLIAEREGLQIRAVTRFAVIALDESLNDEPGVPASLADRLAFRLNLDDVAMGDCSPLTFSPDQIQAARKNLPLTVLSDEICEGLCLAGLLLGVGSLRATIMAARVARVHAALHGRQATSSEDAEAAVRLVLAPCATRLPALEETEDEQQSDPQPERQDPPAGNEDGNDDNASEMTPGQLADLLVEAARAVLPADLLSRLDNASTATSRGGETGGAGAMRKSSTRGRPVGTRPGDLRPGSRLNIVETLRAAAPWQPLRRRQREASGQKVDTRSIEVRKEDFRLNRYQQPSETTAIFVVDASGSSALHRLAEAKGAVELLLAGCYVRREQVALIAFRDDRADLLLPPTRSLVRTKARLTGLAGGGGTPLASALDAALVLALGERKKGRTPVLVVLTDGQANVSRDGTRGREAARADSTDAARRIRQARIESLLLDISPRPSQPATLLAAEMGGIHVPLPYADAKAVSAIVRNHVDAGARPAQVI